MSQRDERELSTSRVLRLGSMARAGLGTASAMLRGSAGGLEDAVERLGQLRGLGTKVGQMAGLVEANLPEELRDKVGPALAKLRDQTATSPWEAVQSLLEAELGAPVAERFDSFEPVPFASASLGQVHRATWQGHDVAVKVQHPGIQEAFRGDLQNISGLASVATTFIMPADAGREFLDAIRGGFLAELDYRAEAGNVALFAELSAGDPDLYVPGVVPERSTGRVLTTRFARGGSVDTAAAFDDAERARLSAAVRRFVMGTLLDHGVLYADAHAGNFLFERGAPVAVVDFGSVVRFDPRKHADLRAMGRAALGSDYAAFERAVAGVVGFDHPRALPAVAKVQWEAFGALLRGDRVDRAQVRLLTENIGEVKRAILGARVPLPPFMPFWMRTLLACVALLAALDAPAGTPLSVPAG
jgi:predicted unusual protein kinase regulating ubiquinone biosynthesis (AarF/ABC1/UbiB family)